MTYVSSNAPWTVAKQRECFDLHDKLKRGQLTADERTKYDALLRERDDVVKRGGLVAIRNAEFAAQRQRAWPL